jgi:hypothetical protein
MWNNLAFREFPKVRRLQFTSVAAKTSQSERITDIMRARARQLQCVLAQPRTHAHGYGHPAPR